MPESPESPEMHETDEALLARYESEGGRAALETLIRRHYAAALRTARAVCQNDALAEEALQEAFLSLVSMRRRAEAARFNGRFKAWFLTNVTNKARMALRGETRARRKARLDPRELSTRAPRFLAPACEGEARNRVQDLFDDLAHLSPRGRQAVWQYFVQDCSQREMALRWGVSQQMVSRMIANGLRELRSRLCSS